MPESATSPAVQPQPSGTAYLWSFPGAPVRVWIELAVVEAISAKLASDAGVAAGVLLGDAEGPTIRIRSFQSVAAATAASFAPVLARHTGGKFRPVGYYTAAARDGVRLDAGEIEVTEQLFRDPGSVVLVIQTGQEIPNASFFFWDNGQFLGDFGFLEFPFDAAELALRTSEKRLAVAPLKDRPKPVSAPVAPAVPVRKSRIRTVLAGSLALITLAGIGAGGFWAVRQGYLPAMGAHAPPLAPEKGKTNPKELAPDMSFGLNAERSGAGVKITWMRNAPAVQAAMSGTVSIRDGQTERTLQLSPEHLRTGSVVLQPRSERVEIKLALLMNDQTVKSETVFLLLESNAPTVQVVRPPPEAPNVANRRTTPAVPEPAVPQTSEPEARRSGPNVSERSSEPVSDVPTQQSVLPALPTNVEVKPPQAPALEPKSVKTEPVRTDVEPSRTVPSQTTPVASPRVTIPNPVHQQKIAMTPLLRSMIVRDVTVSVRVTIDENGRVVQAKAERTVNVNSYVGAAAEAAALQWRYKPATIDGRPVRSESVIEFQFRP